MNTKPMLTAVAAALFSLGACVSAQAADLSTCTTCHSNITKAHAGAAHKDIACTSCHSGVDQHLKKVTDRPTVNMDPATCGGCHQAQYKSLYKDDGRAARQSKKAPNGPAPDPFFDRALGAHGFTVEHDLPRAHVWMAIDQFIVDRAFGAASNPRTAGSMPRSTAASPTRFGMF